LAGLNITVGDQKKVGDFLTACLVLLQPPEREPIL
jgi:hypothetical protein